MNTQPIKRNEALKPFSREHHHGLLLCWKIREGVKRDVDVNRIKRYVDWFWEMHLQSHFEAEEKYVFPILPADDSLIIQVLKDHKKLKLLFEDNQDPTASLQSIAEELDAHIRFEERILFAKIQEKATSEQLQNAAIHHQHTFSDDWEDEFWKG